MGPVTDSGAEIHVAFRIDAVHPSRTKSRIEQELPTVVIVSTDSEATAPPDFTDRTLPIATALVIDRPLPMIPPYVADMSPPTATPLVTFSELPKRCTARTDTELPALR